MITRLPRLNRSISIAKKDLRIYYGKGPVVIFGILLPFFFFFSFLIGRQMAPIAVISGLGGMAIWFTATSISPVIAPWETRTKTLERLVSMPISVTEILLGDIIASTVMGISISGFSIVVAALILDTEFLHPLPFAFSLILASFCFSSIGVLLSALPTDTPADIMMLATLVKFPVVFISGIFIPLEQLPPWAGTLAHLSPLTYFVDILRFTFNGTGRPWLDLAVLFLFSLFFTILAVYAHRKTLPKRL